MNSIKYKWIIISIFSIPIFLFLFIVINIDYSDNIPQYKAKEINNFHLYDHIKNLNQNNLIKDFPYNIYLDSANYDNIVSLRRAISDLDSISKDHMLNQQVLSIALTEKLDERINSNFEKYNPDSLITLIQFAEKFNLYSETDRENAILYRSIYEHWMDYTIKKLDFYYNENLSIKYNYKYKYLVSRCSEKTYYGAVGKTQFEKVVNNVIEKNWSYLFNRFWIATSAPFKTIGFLLMLITLYGYICIFRFHFKK